jgi:hypothetical protein
MHARTHVVAVQAVPSPWYIPFTAAHCACVSSEQNAAAFVAIWRQHAPVAAGGGHIAASHPTPVCHVPCRLAHWAAVVTTQFVFAVVTSGLQQAPRGTQMSLEQVEPLPWNVPLAVAQSAAVRLWQMMPDALVSRQHAPCGGGCGQVVLVHTLLSPL